MKLLHKLTGPFVIRSGKVLDKLEVGAVAMSLENVRAFRQREMPFLVFFLGSTVLSSLQSSL